VQVYAYLVSCNNELNSLGLKLCSDMADTQGIYPCKFSMFSSCLIELFENLDTSHLIFLRVVNVNNLREIKAIK
jgi:hypothetical protein